MRGVSYIKRVEYIIPRLGNAFEIKCLFCMFIFVIKKSFKDK